MRMLTLCLILTSGCASNADAFKALMPVAADTLLKLAKERGKEPNVDSAVCIDMSEDPEVAKLAEQESEVYALCVMGIE